MLKRLTPLATAGTVGFLLASLLNGGTPASAVSTTSDQVKLINYTTCINSFLNMDMKDKLYGVTRISEIYKNCTYWLK